MTPLLQKSRRTAANAWIESADPLAGLSIRQAKNVYNAARRHGSPLLQKIYSEIESSDPVLMTCVERRAAALAGLGWRAVADASAADADAAEEQRLALEAFAGAIENLDEAVEHLDLAFFRGFSVCQPVWEGEAVRHVELLDSWNFLFGDAGELLWNPECTTDPARCVPVTPAARAVVLRRRRAIDWPALAVYVRKYVGERDWGRFLERYGIPPVNAIMAPGSNKETRADYVECVEASHDGRSTAWPAGSQISYAEGARGQDPFSAYIEHQEKQIVLMATGGTLTSLAQADTGSLAGGAQMDVWEQIVARDGVVAAAALNRGLFLPFLRQAFPGAAPLAHFELGKEKEPSATESAELAGKLRAAGYRVDQSQLEEATGCKLEREENPPSPYGFAANKAPGGAGGPPATIPAGEPPAPRLGKDEERLAAAMQRDLRPVGKALATALRTRDWKALRNRLGKILPECGTESAGVLEEAMHAAGEEAQKDTAEAVENSECRAKDPAHCRTHGTPEGWQETGGKGEYTKAHREKIGQRGDWQSLGLPSLRDISPDEPMGKTKIGEAKARIAKGESVTDPLGARHEISPKTTSHWDAKKKSDDDINKRLQALDEAERTIEKPHEIWKRADGRGQAFIRIVKSDGGKTVVNVAEMKDRTVSWHLNDERYDYWRKGVLSYVR